MNTITAEYTETKTWADDLGTHKVETEPEKKKKKPRTLKKDLARLGEFLAKVILVVFIFSAAVALLVGLYLLLGWGLAAGLAFVTGGVIALSVLQGAVAVLLLTFIAGLFR